MHKEDGLNKKSGYICANRMFFRSQQAWKSHMYKYDDNVYG